MVMNTLNGFDGHNESAQNLEKITEMNQTINELKSSLDATNRKVEEISKSIESIEGRLSDLRWIPGYHK